MTTKRWLLALAATTVLSAGATLFAMVILDDEAPPEGIPSFVLPSNVLGERREYLVSLPDEYDTHPGDSYPVLYVLDGASQVGHTADSARLLARIGVVPPMIVVGVPSVSGEIRNRDYTPPDMKIDIDDAKSASGAADRFLSFLETELVPEIDRRYRTARPRMLAGWSRGGLFVVYSQLTAPALFDARLALSPALWRENDAIVLRLQQSMASDAPADGFLYLSLGDRENHNMKAAFEHTVTVLTSQRRSTLRWRADVSAGAVHGTNPVLSTPVGLCAMFRPNESCQGSGMAVFAK